jgi:hypothetical protein
MNNMGCYNQVCRAYFSFGDGEDAKEITSSMNQFTFCKSGMSDDNGICFSRMNNSPRQVPCKSEADCKYTNKIKVALNAPSCTCGHASTGDKFCAMGNGEPEFVNYVELTTTVLNLSSATCHSLERGPTCAIIQKRDTLVKEWTDAQTLAISYQKLIGSDKNVVGSFYDMYNSTIPALGKKQCPKYTCEKDSAHCGEVTGMDDGSKTVKLQVCANETLSVCPIIPIDVTNTYKSATRDCEAPHVKTTSRFPGEACTNNVECVLPFSDCLNTTMTCTGKYLDDTCTTSEECVVGTNCMSVNTTMMTCQKQVAIGGNCTATFDCENNAACYDNKCVK